MNKAGYSLFAVGLAALAGSVMIDDDRLAWLALGGIVFMLAGGLVLLISAWKRVASGAVQIRPHDAIKRFAILLPLFAAGFFAADRLFSKQSDSLAELILKSTVFAALFAISQTAYRKSQV